MPFIIQQKKVHIEGSTNWNTTKFYEDGSNQ